ncbi:hypothetical protein [Rhodococcus sp. 1168]|uniref:hypothetical protein n=1 Tax=Rhodococcus sp. 1168 TaxID=2018041 RepID=UPI0020CB1EFE|nr:hypothetical protein [Rhodococcus sp. 1168]
MGLRKKLSGLAVSLAAFNALLWGLPKIAPEVPERYEGVMAATPPPGTAAKTTAPPLPPGFPSMERPPPKIVVPDGQAQPIATKFGLTYEVPTGWDVWQTGVAGWTGDDGTSARYGALGFYGRTECSDGEHSERAMTGITGRRTLDLNATALAEVEKAEMIFSGANESQKPTVSISGPEKFVIDNQPAVRYRATVKDIPEAEEHCASREATFDVVATPGYATAEVVVFIVRAERKVDNALSDSEIDDLISTLRKS